MLILTRKPDETILIGKDITVTVLGIKGNQVRIGIHAPRGVVVDREEIAQKRKSAEAQERRLALERPVIPSSILNWRVAWQCPACHRILTWSAVSTDTPDLICRGPHEDGAYWQMVRLCNAAIDAAMEKYWEDQRQEHLRSIESERRAQDELDAWGPICQPLRR